MQRKFLEELGLEKEVIDKIMNENGADIEKTKTTLNSQITDLTGQLTSAKDALKSFEGVNVEELKTKITELSTNLTAKETEYQNKIADMEFTSKLESILTGSGARNTKAVKALLDIDSLKSSKNQDADLQTAIETCKKENDYLFGSDEPFKNPVASTGGNPPPIDPLSSMRTAMGLSDKK